MLDPLYTAVSWVLLRWYQLFTLLGLPKTGGVTWALSIIMLVVTARLLMFRFFVKQVHYQRRMQDIQPKIKKLQEKHKGDKATLQREMMALQQAEGFNPITGCLPMFLQIPVFIALFHVLKHMSNSIGLAVDSGARGLTLYGFTAQQTYDASHAKLFKAPLAASLHESSAKILAIGGDVSATRIVTIVLVVVSAGATFLTQRAVIANAPTPAEGQAAMIQKLMLVGIPISVVVSGFIFPLGVLLYWFTSNLWTMGQQFYIHRFHPHPSLASSKPSDVGEQNAVGRGLAPRPGAKPVQNPKVGRGASAASVTDHQTVDDEVEPTLTSDVAAKATPPKPDAKAGGGNASGTTRPAPRPSRPSGNRPSGSRSPGKKRR